MKLIESYDPDSSISNTQIGLLDSSSMSKPNK